MLDRIFEICFDSLSDNQEIVEDIERSRDYGNHREIKILSKDGKIYRINITEEE